MYWPRNSGRQPVKMRTTLSKLIHRIVNRFRIVEAV